LGIPPSEQPPNHYRLLDLPLFETDFALISDAALKRIQKVRIYQLTKGELCHRLLNELARARVCLLDTEKKEDYDTLLRSLLAEAKQKAEGSNKIRISLDEINAVRPPTERQKIKIEAWEIDDVNLNRLLSDLHQASSPNTENQDVGVCNICSYPIEQQLEKKTVCSACGLPFHSECWHEIGGCSAYGCTNVNLLNPAEVVNRSQWDQERAVPTDEAFQLSTVVFIILSLLFGLFVLLLVLD
jgi:hypothetical protein